jgi:hypothetical protein
VVFATQMTEWLDRFSSEFMNIQEVVAIEEPDDVSESAD